MKTFKRISKRISMVFLALFILSGLLLYQNCSGQGGSSGLKFGSGKKAVRSSNTITQSGAGGSLPAPTGSGGHTPPPSGGGGGSTIQYNPPSDYPESVSWPGCSDYGGGNGDWSPCIPRFY